MEREKTSFTSIQLCSCPSESKPSESDPSQCFLLTCRLSAEAEKPLFCYSPIASQKQEALSASSSARMANFSDFPAEILHVHVRQVCSQDDKEDDKESSMVTTSQGTQAAVPMQLPSSHVEESLEPTEHMSAARGTAPLLKLLESRREREKILEECDLASQVSSDPNPETAAVDLTMTSLTRPCSVSLNKLTASAGLFAIKKSLFASNEVPDKHEASTCDEVPDHVKSGHESSQLDPPGETGRRLNLPSESSDANAQVSRHEDPKPQQAASKRAAELVDRATRMRRSVSRVGVRGNIEAERYRGDGLEDDSDTQDEGLEARTLQATRKVSKSTSPIRHHGVSDRQKENVDDQTYGAAKWRSEDIEVCGDEQDALQVVRVPSNSMEVDDPNASPLDERCSELKRKLGGRGCEKSDGEEDMTSREESPVRSVDSLSCPDGGSKILLIPRRAARRGILEEEESRVLDSHKEAEAGDGHDKTADEHAASEKLSRKDENETKQKKRRKGNKLLPGCCVKCAVSRSREWHDSALGTICDVCFLYHANNRLVLPKESGEEDAEAWEDEEVHPSTSSCETSQVFLAGGGGGGGGTFRVKMIPGLCRRCGAKWSEGWYDNSHGEPLSLCSPCSFQQRRIQSPPALRKLQRLDDDAPLLCRKDSVSTHPPPLPLAALPPPNPPSQADQDVTVSCSQVFGHSSFDAEGEEDLMDGDELASDATCCSSLFSGFSFIITAIRGNDPNFGGSNGRDNLVALINRNGGQVLEKVEDLITEHENVKSLILSTVPCQTFKYLAGLAAGVLPVGTQWIVDSSKEGKLEWRGTRRGQEGGEERKEEGASGEHALDR
eukprot:764022-Hanusia_phi.AAC.9